MLNFSLIGAGRIGKMHAEIINSNPNSKLKFVYDVNKEFAKNVASFSNAKIVNQPEDAINSSETDAVLIASATPTHRIYKNGNQMQVKLNYVKNQLI